MEAVNKTSKTLNCGEKKLQMTTTVVTISLENVSKLDFISIAM